MRTRVGIGLTCFVAVALGVAREDLAAVYVALAAGAIIFLLDAIEFKINKLLDERGIAVSDFDVARK